MPPEREREADESLAVEAAEYQGVVSRLLVQSPKNRSCRATPPWWPYLYWTLTASGAASPAISPSRVSRNSSPDCENRLRSARTFARLCRERLARYPSNDGQATSSRASAELNTSGHPGTSASCSLPASLRYSSAQLRNPLSAAWLASDSSSAWQTASLPDAGSAARTGMLLAYPILAPPRSAGYHPSAAGRSLTA